MIGTPSLSIDTVGEGRPRNPHTIPNVSSVFVTDLVPDNEVVATVGPIYVTDE